MVDSLTPATKCRMIVLIPDSTGTLDALRPLVNWLRSQPEIKDDHIVPLPFKLQPWSNRDLNELATDLNSRIENYYLEHRGSISGIVLCGYSLGVLLARRTYLDAVGYSPSRAVKEWAVAVERIVFIAAICRGFNKGRFYWWQRLGLALFRILGQGRAIRSAFAGEPFVNNVRLDWIHHIHTNGYHPLVVNFLGTGDKLVKPEDAIDILQDPEARHIDIPGRDHDTVIDPTGAERLYREGFLGQPRPGRPPEVDGYKRADRVYLLLHGMRSSKRFMTELATALQTRDPAADVRKPDYGYIALGPFLSRSQRCRKAAQFVDDYTQCLSLNPHAKIFFVGHSNGTAILGHALLENRRMRFARLYLGGSALPTRYDWRTIVEDQDRHQITEFIRSDRGTSDWAVGILARALERLSRWFPSFRGLGSAGYDGFEYGAESVLNEPICEGSHSDMFTPDRIASIVSFLTAPERLVEPELAMQSPRWFVILHKHADIVACLGVLMLAVVIAASLLSAFWPLPLPLLSFGGPYVGIIIVVAILYVLFRW